MAKFGTFIAGDGDTFGSTSGVFPIEGLDRVPWVFQDPGSDDIYEFAVNPADANIPAVQKRITTQYSASGRAINWEGRREVPTISFSGTILHQAHYEVMLEWFAKSTQINLTDDFGRDFWLYLTNFSPTRDYTYQYPWRHEYSASGIIISWA